MYNRKVDSCWTGSGQAGSPQKCRDSPVINLYVYVCMYVYIYIYIYVYIHTCMYIYIYMYTHMCIYIYIYMSMFTGKCGQHVTTCDKKWQHART